jgi:hypothetical protein
MQCLSGYLTSQARSMRCDLSRAASLLVPMPAPASSAWATSRVSVGCDLPGPRQAQLDGWHFHANVWSPCTITTAWSGSVAIFSVLRWPGPCASSGRRTRPDRAGRAGGRPASRLARRGAQRRPSITTQGGRSLHWRRRRSSRAVAARCTPRRGSASRLQRPSVRRHNSLPAGSRQS